MATIAKNFKVKHGLVVDGTVATVNGSNVLTEASTTFLNNLISDQAGSLLANATLSNLTVSYDASTNSLTLAAENGVADSTTDDLSEGVTNLYFTDERAQDAFGTLVANGTYTGATVTYDDATNAFSISIADQFPSHDTDDLAEGSNNLYFTDARAISAIENAQSVSMSGDLYANIVYADVRDVSGAQYALQSYADQAEADAISTAAADATSKANTAESNANDRTDLLIGDATVDGTAGNTVTDRIDTAVANLIGGAPELLDTLDEIAAAIADDENFSTTVVSDIAQGLTDAKAYTDTRETAITTAYQSYADTAEADAISTAAADATAKADAAEADAISTAAADATSKANAAQAAAEATASADATSKANTAESNANTFTTNAIDALDTDDIEEGASNLYFTDTRAKVSAADLLTNATQTNISITGDENGLTISAENGVADSTTDDLTEGSTNLYFTDQRAVDALEAVTPTFTEVDVNSVALNVASAVTVATQNTTGTVYSFDSGTYQSAKFLVKAATGSHSEITEVLLTLDDSNNIAITEYAMVNTGGALMSVTAIMNGTDVELQVTAVNDNTTVHASGTLIV